PLNAWFQEAHGQMLRDVLLSERALGRCLFDPVYLKRMVDEQLTGRHNRGRQLWALLMLELWLREFID
ncbi:MAG: asparagine synthetase B, partial [Magnetococcales bacterium]|nr:asparagine synthetase B [Magnetococcales bacterium]